MKGPLEVQSLQQPSRAQVGVTTMKEGRKDAAKVIWLLAPRPALSCPLTGPPRAMLRVPSLQGRLFSGQSEGMLIRCSDAGEAGLGPAFQDPQRGPRQPGLLPWHRPPPGLCPALLLPRRPSSLLPSGVCSPSGPPGETSSPLCNGSSWACHACISSFLGSSGVASQPQTWTGYPRSWSAHTPITGGIL